MEQKSLAEDKVKGSADAGSLGRIQNTRVPRARVQDTEARGVRKITTGITGLWLPSAQSDVAF